MLLKVNTVSYFCLFLSAQFAVKNEDSSLIPIIVHHLKNLVTPVVYSFLSQKKKNLISVLTFTFGIYILTCYFFPLIVAPFQDTH